MDAKLESIERRAKTLGWKCWGPHSPPDNTNIVLLSPDAGIELIVDESNYTAAERLLAVYEAPGDEGPVVEINPPITCAFFIERERPDKPGDQLIGDCQLLEIDKCTHGEKPCPGAGRYRLVRVGDVEVGSDAR